MESQNEVHQKTGNEKVTETDKQPQPQHTRRASDETREIQPAPFSEFDPFRSARIDALHSEAKDLSTSLSIKLTGIDGLNENELRAFQEDAEERQRWSKARQDAFGGIVRLGANVPPRANRVL